MRRWVLPLLVLANVGLTLWLASLWFTPQGRLLDVSWRAPSPVAPALDTIDSLPSIGVDAARYIATLEHPLFSPSRRPPPPPQAASATPVSDAPPDLFVLGLYGSHEDQADAKGGVIVRVDGQVKRLKVGDTIGPWTLKAIRPGEAVLSLGEIERAYELRRVVSEDSVPAGEAARVAPPTAAPSMNAAQAMREQDRREMRERVRRMNVLRARTGLPPLPEP